MRDLPQRRKERKVKGSILKLKILLLTLLSRDYTVWCELGRVRVWYESRSGQVLHNLHCQKARGLAHDPPWLRPKGALRYHQGGSWANVEVLRTSVLGKPPGLRRFSYQTRALHPPQPISLLTYLSRDAPLRLVLHCKRIQVRDEAIHLFFGEDGPPIGHAGAHAAAQHFAFQQGRAGAQQDARVGEVWRGG